MVRTNCFKPKAQRKYNFWSLVEGKTRLDNIIGLDTGCVWGKKLTAMRLEDKKIFQVKKNEDL